MTPDPAPGRTRLGVFVAFLALFAVIPLALAPTARGDAARFVRHRRGVVDTRSGIVWRAGEPRFLAWDAARAYCRDLDRSSGWRLPSVDELAAMVVPEPAPHRPTALVPEVFVRATGAAYWSSDRRTRRDASHRLAVDEDGSVDDVFTRMPLAVRCVRSLEP